MKFPSRTEILDRIPNKYDAVIAVSLRVKMLTDGKKRICEEYDDNPIKTAMTEIASGALVVDIEK
mgnify:CR=1 FL=1